MLKYGADTVRRSELLKMAPLDGRRDMQAAIGVSQLKKLPGFVVKRRQNFGYLSDMLAQHEDKWILPKVAKGRDPSWFGFPSTVRPTTRRSSRSC